MKAKKIGIGVLIGLVILAILGGVLWLVLPKLTGKSAPTELFRAHITISVDGQAYTPKESDVLDADRVTVNADGSIDCAVNEGIYGIRDLTIQIDGMTEPLMLRTMISDNRYLVDLNVNVDVDSTAKKAVVTGELTSNNDAKLKKKFGSETWSIYRELDMTASPENYDKIGGTL